MKRIQHKRDCSPTTLPTAPSVGVKVEAGGSVLDRLERISVILDRLEIISASDRAFQLHFLCAPVCAKENNISARSLSQLGILVSLSFSHSHSLTTHFSLSITLSHTLSSSLFFSHISRALSLGRALTVYQSSSWWERGPAKRRQEQSLTADSKRPRSVVP